MNAPAQLARLVGIEQATPEQQAGLACALCGVAIPPRWQAARKAGPPVTWRGSQWQLWVCAPRCPPLPTAGPVRPVPLTTVKRVDAPAAPDLPAI
jgi:hypothetical protein